MKGHGVAITAAAFLIAALSFVFLTNAHVAFGRPSKSKQKRANAGPTAFGRVFEANRSSLVRVECGRDRIRWTTGFLIGAEGELVFGIDRPPKQELLIAVGTEELAGELLGYDLGLSLAVGRIRRGGRWSPLRVAQHPGLDQRSWVMALTHDARGRAQPYAGVVEGALEHDRKRKTPIHVLVAPVLVPGALGSPVLSVQGELVGVVIESGERKTGVVPIDIVTPFVKAVVLGRNAR